MTKRLRDAAKKFHERTLQDSFETKSDANAERAEPLTGELRRLRESLQKVVADWYGQTLFSSLTITADGSLSLGDVDAALRDSAGGVIEELFKVSGESALRELEDAGFDAAVGVSFDVVPENAIAAIERSTDRFTAEVVQHETERTREILRQSLEDGQTTDEIADALREDFGGQYGAGRAEMVARTEVAYASSEGRVEAWRSVGIDRKQWLLSPNPCVRCAGFAAKFSEPIDASQPFLKVGDSYPGSDGNTYKVSFRDLQGPPLHPNCRCAVVAVVE